MVGILTLAEGRGEDYCKILKYNSDHNCVFYIKVQEAEMTEQTDGNHHYRKCHHLCGSDSIPELSNESNNTNASIVVLRHFQFSFSFQFLVRNKEIKAYKSKRSNI